MAQLTREWQELGTVYCGNTGYGDVYLNFMAILVSQDTTNNKSRIGIGLRIYTSNGTWSSQCNDTLDGNYQDLGYRTFGAGHEFIHIIEKDIQHNNDGTASSSFSGSFWSYFFGTKSGSISFTLPTIPRYAKITSFSVSVLSETSVKYSWSADSTCDYAWYSTDNGSTWKGLPNNNTITGLNPNTSYNFKLRVRRASSQLLTSSSTVNKTTYQYPYVSAVGKTDLTIGEEQTLTLYNPLSRSVNVYMKKDNESGLEFYNGSTSGTTIKFTPDSELLYNSIPNNPSGNAIYYCVYSNQKVSTKSGTYKVDVNTNKPTFENFEYSTDFETLTGNTNTIIDNKTTTKITINNLNKAIPLNGSSIAKYRFECGSAIPVEIEESESDIIANIINCNDAILKITAIDSRGLETTLNKNVENYILYSQPIFSNISVERVDGVEAESHLNLDVTYWNENFGSLDNILTEAKYRTKESSSEEWSNWFNLNLNDFEYDQNRIRLRDALIHENGTSGGFTVGIQYNVQVMIGDGASNVILSEVISDIQTLTDGKIGISMNKDYDGNYHIGINCMPDPNETIVVDGKPIEGGSQVVDTLEGEEIDKAPSVRAIKEYVDGEILWTNSNPSSAMAKDVQINLNSSDYDMLEIFYKVYNTGSYVCSQKIVKGYSTVLTSGFYAGKGRGTYYRELVRVNDTTYKTGNGEYYASNGNGNDMPNMNIPIYIVGYKTRIFS